MKNKRYARYRGFTYISYSARIERWVDEHGEFWRYNTLLRSWSHEIPEGGHHAR